MVISSEKIPKTRAETIVCFDYKVLSALRTKGIFRCCLLTDLDVKKFQFFFTLNAPKSKVDLIFKNERRGGLACRNQPGDGD